MYLGVVKGTNEIVTIEEYTDGKFVKYVNNDGTTCNGNNNDQQMKAESLVHYSFIKSNKKMLVVDIQGANFNLTDPEIATLSGHFDEEKHFLFCAGNFSMEAYTKFFQNHKCSAFCSLLGLEEESME